MKVLQARPYLAIYLLFTVLALSLVGQAQALHSDPNHPLVQRQVTRDERGMTILEAAVASLGGKTNIIAIKALSATGTLGSDGGHFEWQSAGHEFHTKSTFPLHTFETSSGSGKPFTRSDGSTHELTADKTDFTFIPIAIASILLDMVSDPHWSVHYVNPPVTTNNMEEVVECKFVTTAIAEAVSVRRISFSVTTHLPVSIEFRKMRELWPHYTTHTYRYDNFATYSDVLFPLQVTHIAPAIPPMVESVTTLTLNPQETSDIFTAQIAVQP